MDKYAFYEKNLKIEEKPIDKNSLTEYIAFDGYLALEKVVTSMTPEEVIEEIIKFKN